MSIKDKFNSDEYSIENNPVVNKRKMVKAQYRFLNIKKKLFVLGIFISLVIVILMYFYNPNTNVRVVHFDNNTFLKDEYLLELSEITTDSKYLLVFNHVVEQNLLASPFIKDVIVTHDIYNSIIVDVEEYNVLAYQYNDEPKLIIEDGSTILMDESTAHLISYVPIIFGGYTKEMLVNLANALNKLDRHIIENIAEIHNHQEEYDPNMLRIVMRDGRNIYTSLIAIETVNVYYDIINDLTPENKCLYTVELTSNIYSSACPWELVENDENIEEDEGSIDEE